MSTSELTNKIWALSWAGGSWPVRSGVTYEVADKARAAAIAKHPDRDPVIVTFEAASRYSEAIKTRSDA